MKTKAKVTMNYGKCSSIERANLIYMNYATFEVIIECFKEDLINDIQSEQRYIKRSGHGELGVRVQGSGMYSDPTESQASSFIMLDKLISDETLSEEELGDLLDCENLLYRYRTLYLMKKDYHRFNMQLRKLEPSDREIMIPFLNREKDYIQLSDEQGITIASMRTRVYRIRKDMLEELAHNLVPVFGKGVAYGSF